MGYDVHITRKAQWFDEDGPPLSLDEWLHYVSTDEEMRVDGFAEAKTLNGETVRIDDPGIVVWLAYSGNCIGGNMAWFGYFADRVTVKNPDREILRKMHQIASSLDAHVQGDEGEEYGQDGEVLKGNSNSEPRKPWWRFW